MFQNAHKEEPEQSEYLSLSKLSDKKVKSNNFQYLAESKDQSELQSSQPYRLLSKGRDGEGEGGKRAESAETSEEENVIHTLFSKIVPAKLRSGAVSNSLSGSVLSDNSAYADDTSVKVTQCLFTIRVN